MILTTEDVDTRLEHPDNLVNKITNINNKSNVEIRPQDRHPGRAEGTLAIPDKMKELLGSLAQKTTLVEVAKTFDIGVSTTSNYARGITSDNKLNPSLKEAVSRGASKIQSASEVAHESALDMLVETLEVLKPKIKDVVKPKDLAKIATDMSRIASNLSPKESTTQNNTQVILYAPKLKQENFYETAEV